MAESMLGCKVCFWGEGLEGFTITQEDETHVFAYGPGWRKREVAIPIPKKYADKVNAVCHEEIDPDTWEKILDENDWK